MQIQSRQQQQQQQLQIQSQLQVQQQQQQQQFSRTAQVAPVAAHQLKYSQGGARVAVRAAPVQQSMSRIAPRCEAGTHAGPFDVFISHNQKDSSDLARSIKEYLTNKQLKVFLDRDSDTVSGLLGEVAASRCVVAILSRGLLTSHWCISELTTALTNKIPVIIVQHPDATHWGSNNASSFPTEDEMPRQLKPLFTEKVLTMHREFFHETMHRVLDRLQSKLSGMPPPSVGDAERNQLLVPLHLHMDLLSSMPHATTYRVVRMLIDEEACFSNVWVRCEAHGGQLRVRVYTDADTREAFACFYKTITAQYVVCKLLVRNEPVVLIVDCNSMRYSDHFEYDSSKCCVCVKHPYWVHRSMLVPLVPDLMEIPDPSLEMTAEEAQMAAIRGSSGDSSNKTRGAIGRTLAGLVGEGMAAVLCPPAPTVQWLFSTTRNRENESVTWFSRLKVPVCTCCPGPACHITVPVSWDTTPVLRGRDFWVRIASDKVHILSAVCEAEAPRILKTGVSQADAEMAVRVALMRGGTATVNPDAAATQHMHAHAIASSSSSSSFEQAKRVIPPKLEPFIPSHVEQATAAAVAFSSSPSATSAAVVPSSAAEIERLREKQEQRRMIRQQTERQKALEKQEQKIQQHAAGQQMQNQRM